jgi:hypothetical protein
MINHSKLTQAESRIMRLMLSTVAALIGFCVGTGVLCLLANTVPVTGTAHAVETTAPTATAVPVIVPGVVPTDTVSVTPSPETPVPAPEVPVETTPEVPEVTTPETTTPTPETTTPAPVAEDDPGWRCDTMGNRVCGVPDAYGTFVLICHDVTGYPIRVVYDPTTCA